MYSILRIQLYSILRNTHFSDPGESNPIVYPTKKETFLLTVTDDKNCTTSDDINVEVLITDIIDQAKILVEVFPNPTDGEFTVKINDLPDDKEVKISLSDISGRLIYKGYLYQNQRIIFNGITLPEIENGIYILKINIDNRDFMKKIIVE